MGLHRDLPRQPGDLRGTGRESGAYHGEGVGFLGVSPTIEVTVHNQEAQEARCCDPGSRVE